jgi:hypothetical protein
MQEDVDRWSCSGLMPFITQPELVQCWRTVCDIQLNSGTGRKKGALHLYPLCFHSLWGLIQLSLIKLLYRLTQLTMISYLQGVYQQQQQVRVSELIPTPTILHP